VNTPLISSDTLFSNIQSNKYIPLLRYKGDTLGYVEHNFINNKQKYVGKNLNTLLNDLEIPIKSFIPNISYLTNDDVPSVYLQFFPLKEASRRKHTVKRPVDIIIKWANTLPMDTVFLLGRKNNYSWTDEERKYFGKQIIGDVLTTKD